MLRELRIWNLALIERLELSFEEGLTILTGETGAGKSLLIDAVALLLGVRASPDWVRSGAREAVVEGTLAVEKGSPVLAFLSDQGVECDGELLIRRNISSEGRSRAFLNGVSVPLSAIQEVTRPLIDLQGQHEQQSLLRPDRPLQLLDAFGGLVEEREQHARQYDRLKSLEEELQVLASQEEGRRSRSELLREELHAITAAQVRGGEDRELEAEQARLSNAHRLAELAHLANELLYAGEPSALELIKKALAAVGEIARLDPSSDPSFSTLESPAAQVREVSGLLRDYRERLEQDPGRLDWVADRLHLLTTLKRRYGGTLEAVLEAQGQLAAEQSTLEGADQRLDELQKIYSQVREEAERIVETLSRRRRAAAQELERRVNRELVALEVPLKFSVEIVSIPPNATGGDQSSFQIQNPGEEPHPLSRVASGGELSRVLLAIHTILADVDSTSAMIFDEADAGVGGRAAERIGRRLKALARRRQVLCVTHLPQIAGLADHHYRVLREEKGGRSITRVEQLSRSARVEELARMVAGTAITTTAREHARTLLDLADEP